MRDPRPENFDPKVRKPIPEAVNMTGVVALRTSAPDANLAEMDRRDPQSQPVPEGNQFVMSPMPSSVRNSERTEFRSEMRSEQRTELLPFKRRTKRYSFEFYEDQLVKLKQLKRQAEDRGESLTLSDMARAALDSYLKRK